MDTGAVTAPRSRGETYVDFPCADADSHLMELPTWLAPFVPPDVLPRLGELDMTCAGATTPDDIRTTQDRLAGPPSTAALEDLLDVKGWSAVGGSDPTERSLALDVFGYEAQVVYSTLATTQFPRDPDGFDACVRAHNRAMAEFCGHDARLLPTAFVPLTETGRSVALLDDALTEGCRAVLVPFNAPPRSPGHPDFDPYWARLAEAGVPAAFHLGHGPQTFNSAFHNTGTPSADFLGTERSLRSKDAVVAHHGIEIMLTCLVLDGVLERHPSLNVVCLEFGAGWVHDLMRRLDLVEDYRATEPLLSTLRLRPSEYMRRQVVFCPRPDEDLHTILGQLDPEMLAFASDFPHPEGGRDPVGSFLPALQHHDERVAHMFFRENFRRVYGA